MIIFLPKMVKLRMLTLETSPNLFYSFFLCHSPRTDQVGYHNLSKVTHLSDLSCNGAVTSSACQTVLSIGKGMLKEEWLLFG